MSANDIWLRGSEDEDPDDVRLYYFEEVIGEAVVIYVTDSIALSDVPRLVSPVFVTDAIHLADVAYRLFHDIEVLGEDWAWMDTYVQPSSTPISGSSPPKQDPYLLVLAKDEDWYWYLTLVPVMDLEIKEGGVLEQSIIADLPSGAEKGIVQYLGSEDDLVLLRLRGPVDMLRQLDYLNRRDYITVRIRCNGVTWWQGYVRFLNFAGQPVIASEVNQVTVYLPSKGKAEAETRTMIGMFGECPDQARYLLVLAKAEDWKWHNPLAETSEEI